MDAERVIEFEDVSFSYGGAPVLENVTLALKSGDFVSVVGPNGGGKTTLLKLILGALKAERGKVSVFGGQPKSARARVGCRVAVCSSLRVAYLELEVHHG